MVNRQSQAVGMFGVFVCCMLRITRVLCCTQRVVYAAHNACLEVALCPSLACPSSESGTHAQYSFGNLTCRHRRCHTKRAEI